MLEDNQHRHLCQASPPQAKLFRRRLLQPLTKKKSKKWFISSLVDIFVCSHYYPVRTSRSLSSGVWRLSEKRLYDLKLNARTTLVSWITFNNKNGTRRWVNSKVYSRCFAYWKAKKRRSLVRLSVSVFTYMTSLYLLVLSTLGSDTSSTKHTSSRNKSKLKLPTTATSLIPSSEDGKTLSSARTNFSSKILPSGKQNLNFRSSKETTKIKLQL